MPSSILTCIWDRGYSYDQGQDKWTIGFNVTLPIFDQNRGPIAEAHAKRREASANFNALQAKALGELERALASYRGALAKLETADQLLAGQDKTTAIRGRPCFKRAKPTGSHSSAPRVEWHAANLSRLDAFIEAQQALATLEDAAQMSLKHE